MVAKEDFTSNDKYIDKDWETFSTHDYVYYDPVHTWIEYLNRLLGALSGIPILILAIWSICFFKENFWITCTAILTLLGILFQAWLGKTVVDSNLLPYKITFHMVMALLIVYQILYLIFATKTTFKTQKYSRLFYKILCFGIILSLFQIILGTQVREFIDEQTKLIGYDKTLWLDSPKLNFYIHRSTSILVLLLNGYLWFYNKKYKLGFKKFDLLIVCIGMEILTGVMMYYFDFPFLSQPSHLIIASIMIGIQTYILFELRHVKKMIKINDVL